MWKGVSFLQLKPTYVKTKIQNIWNLYSSACVWAQWGGLYLMFIWITLGVQRLPKHVCNHARFPCEAIPDSPQMARINITDVCLPKTPTLGVVFLVTRPFHVGSERLPNGSTLQEIRSVIKREEFISRNFNNPEKQELYIFVYQELYLDYLHLLLRISVVALS